MAPRCGCGSSSTCACLVTAGDNVTVSGTGSASNPYVINSTGGSPVVTTLAALGALQAGSALVPGQTYVVTDWTQPNLPGPNRMTFVAAAVNDLNDFVLIDTPLTLELGPNRGIYNWALGQLIYVEDGLDNKIEAVGSTAIADFPFGNVAWGGNTIIGSGPGLTGAIAAAAAGCGFAGNLVQGGGVNMTAWLTGNISSSTFRTGTLTCGADTTASSLFLDNCNVSVAAVATSILEYSSVVQSPFTVSNPNSFSLSHSEIKGGTTFTDVAATRGFVIDRSTLIDATIVHDGSTGGTDEDHLENCLIQASALNWQQTVDPAGDQYVRESSITGNSVVNITDPDTITFMFAENVVQMESTVNLQAGASIQNSRFAALATVNTGAFAHVALIVEYDGVTTLTANNTNKRRDSLGSNVV